MVWVGDDGKPLVNYNPGMGSLPGQALRREADLLSRLPDAQLVGYEGPSVVNPQSVRGARPDEPDPVPARTYRPLAGLKQQNRGQIMPFEIGGLATTNAQRVNSFVETPRNNGDDAEIVAVTLGFELQQDTTDTTTPAPEFLNEFDPRALVEWGVGGANFTAEVDWSLGSTFSLVASFVRIGLFIPAISILGATFQTFFAASLGYGSPAIIKPPRLTLNPLSAPPAPQTLLPGAQTSILVLPSFAESFTITQGWGPGAAQPIRAQLFRGVGGTNVASFLMNDYTNNGYKTERTFPIPNGARLIQLTNMGVAATGPLRIIYNLGF